MRQLLQQSGGAATLIDVPVSLPDLFESAEANLEILLRHPEGNRNLFDVRRVRVEPTQTTLAWGEQVGSAEEVAATAPA